MNHTPEECFRHFLSYTNYSLTESPEVIEKLREAYIAGCEPQSTHQAEARMTREEMADIAIEYYQGNFTERTAIAHKVRMRTAIRGLIDAGALRVKE